MKRITLHLRAAHFALAFLTACIIACAPLSALADSDASDLPYCTDHVLVTCDDAGASVASSRATQQQASEELQALGMEVDEVIADSSEQTGTVVSAELPHDLTVADAVQELDGAEGVASVQPDFIYHSLDVRTNDTYFSSQYYLSSAGFTKAWDQARCEAGASVTVAVVDTGCLLSHEDLKGTVRADLAWSAVEGKALSKVTNDVSSDSHGTHVCGIVGAQANNRKGIAGASYNARILPVRVFNSKDEASTSSLLSAFSYLRGLVDKGKLTDLRVINLSLGYYVSAGPTSVDRQLQKQIRILREKYNVLCVCAGGNGDDESGEPLTTPLYPSDFDESFSVTALTKKGTDASYSDYNMKKDLSAPGESIKSAAAKGASSYVTHSGTSMAAPLVSAAAALMWSANPDLSVDEVQEILKTTAKPLTHDAKRRGRTGSAGMLDASAAVKAAIAAGSRTSISAATVGSVSAAAYRGSAIAPSPEVRLDGRLLEKGTDYVLRYESNVNAGIAAIQVIGKGAYSGSKRVHFTINPVKLSSSKVKLKKKTFTYSGARVRPTVLAYGLGGKRLAASVDFRISGTRSTKKVGTFTLKVTGTGNYKGTVKRTYTVNPPRTKISWLFSGSGSLTVVVAKRTAQVTGYQVQYSTSARFASSKRKRMGSSRSVVKSVSGLKRGKRYYVRARTYKTVRGRTYYSAWSAAWSVVTR